LAAHAFADVPEARVAPELFELDPVVVTATRTPVPVSQLGTAVTVVVPEDIARRQVTTLTDALSGAAGTPVRTGAMGGGTSIFLRGSNSNQTLVLVDGIRASDASSVYSGYVGGASALSTDRIEVARGPQSMVFGADAIGGVIAIGTERGGGEPSARIAGEAGSFGTYTSTVAAQGEKNASAYNFAATGFSTQNDRENNDFESLTAAGRVDHRVDDALNLGGTIRVFRGVYGSPGAAVGAGANDPDNEDRETNALGTLFAEFTPSGEWEGKITVGGQERRFVSEDPTASAKTDSVTRRGVFDAQAIYSGLERNRVTVGGTMEWTHFTTTGFGTPSAHNLDYAVFAQDEFSPTDTLTITAGARQDEFDSFGGRTTGRGALAWRVVPEVLKLRGSFGTGFRAPSFLDSYGFFSGLYRGNPNLSPERSTGWDAGLDWSLPGRRGVVSATYFRNDYKDLIDGFAFVGGSEPFTAENVGEAHSQGFEFSATWIATPSTRVSAGYTYTEAINDITNTRLLRRPRHSATMDVWNDFGGGISAGVGATFAADAKDGDAASPLFATIDGEDYVVARLYAAWALNERLTFTARVENLFDEEYAQVNGFPSLGIGAFAGAEWKF
jgi:vitamin B12 transporter